MRGFGGTTQDLENAWVLVESRFQLGLMYSNGVLQSSQPRCQPPIKQR